MKAPDKEYEYSTGNNSGGGGDDRGYFAPPPTKYPSKYRHEQHNSSSHSSPPRPPHRYMYPTQQPPPASYYHGHNYDPHLMSPASAPTSSSSSSIPQKHGSNSGDGSYYYPYARYPGYATGAPSATTQVSPEHDQLPPSVSMSPALSSFQLPQSRDADSPAPTADSEADANADAAPFSAPGADAHEDTEPAPADTTAKIRDRDLNDKDVLSGRGGGTNNHAGNKNFRQLVDQYRSEYVLSKKWAKRQIARSIVMSIRSNGGRFLKKEGSYWRDIGDQKAREKTSQALREGLAAKMRQAYRESGAAMGTTARAAAASEPSSSSRPGDDYYSPRSISGRVHPRSESEYRDPYHYERYDNYEQPYEYYPQPHQPQQQQHEQHIPDSPAKRRRLTYDPNQQEAV